MTDPEQVSGTCELDRTGRIAVARLSRMVAAPPTSGVRLAVQSAGRLVRPKLGTDLILGRATAGLSGRAADLSAAGDAGPACATVAA
jgi:hypothetical protein